MQQGKMVVAGNSGVGKTCIILQFCNNLYNAQQDATINAAFFRKEYVIDGKQVALSIWDTAGQERFQSMSQVYFRGAQYALIIFDITNAESFESSKYWSENVFKRSQVKTKRFLIGNKCDLVSERQVASEQAKDYAELNGIQYYEVSARTGAGILELFNDVGRDYIANHYIEDLPKAEEVIKVSIQEKRKGGCC